MKTLTLLLLTVLHAVLALAQNTTPLALPSPKAREAAYLPQEGGHASRLPDSTRQGLPVDLGRVQAKAARYEAKLGRQTEKYLSRLERQERRLKRKLHAKDSLAATRLFGEPKERYAKLREELREQGGKAKGLPNTYLGHVDSMKTSLAFLEGQPGLAAEREKLKAGIGGYERLEGKLVQAEQVKRFVRQRQQQLQGPLTQHGMGKELRAYQKHGYYYKAQVKEYREQLANPSRYEERVLQAVRKHPAFQAYFRQHAQLASMFRLPSAGAAVADGKPLPGLQTLSGLQQRFEERLGEKAREVVEQGMQHVQQEFDQLKAKITEAGSAEAAEIPGFRPNSQKTKSLWKRLELGADFQTARGSSFFPVTSDMGLSLGYRLHDKAVAGLGASYKMGWGESIRRIDFTQQGMGLRSFMDYRLKGSLWLAAGAELNYRPRPNKDVTVPPGYEAWQRAALVGITKKYRVSSKYGGKVQLLYDFLHRQHVPRSQPVLFRVGYTF